MMTTTPKLRTDLRSTTVEDADGVSYVDVADPKTGGVLRLFDYEWQLAQRMDGQRSADELARWAEEQFRFSISRDDLQVYAERLGQLGLLDGVAAQPSLLPPVLFASAMVARFGGAAAAVSVVPAVAATTVPEKPVEKPVEKSVEKPVEIAPAKRPVRDDDGLMGQPILAVPKATGPAPTPAGPRQTPAAVAQAHMPPLGPPRQTPVTTAVVQPAATAPSGPTAAPAVKPVAAKPVESEPAALPVTPIAKPKSDMLEALGELPPPPEVAPAAVVEAPAVTPSRPVVETPASAVADAISSTPTSLLDVVPVAAPPREPVAAPVSQPSVLPPAKISGPTAAVPGPKSSGPTPAVPSVAVAQPEPVAPVVAPVVKPPVVTPPVVTPPVVKPPVAETAPEKSGGGLKWALVLVVLAVVAAVAYYFVAMQPPPTPPALGVKVSEAKAEDVTRFFATPALVKKAEPQTLKIEAGGAVSKFAAENIEVAAGGMLVQLAEYTKLNAEAVDLRARIGVYQKKIDAAKAKNKVDKDSQTKVGEKQQRLEQVEAELKKVQLLAKSAGTVSKVLVKAGQAVTAGAEVIAVADKALAAEIKIPAIESQGMKAGQEVALTAAGGPLAARISVLKAEGEYTVVQFSLPETTTAKVGDELKLQRSPLTQVVRLPGTALTDGNKVFVMRDGKAAAATVTVADRDGESVLVQGLQTGDKVITSRIAELREGVAVMLEGAAPASR